MKNKKICKNNFLGIIRLKSLARVLNIDNFCLFIELRFMGQETYGFQSQGKIWDLNRKLRRLTEG